MGLTLDSPLSSCMTNKRRLGALKALGVTTVGDALTYYPFRVTDPLPRGSIRQIKVGQKTAFAAKVRRVRTSSMNSRRGYRVEVQVDDGDAAASFVFFSYKKHYVDWLLGKFREKRLLVAAGEASIYGGSLQFTHPQVLMVGQEPGMDVATTEEGFARLTEPQPVYHASSRISSEHIHESILGLIPLLDPDSVPDIIPEEVRKERGLLHRFDALKAIHKPETTEEFWKGIDSMRSEEALVSQTALLQEREKMRESKSFACSGEAGEEDLVQRFIQSLPFSLTAGQKEVIERIQTDMGQAYPMSRLLQGEVGSGKTVVALASMLGAAQAGYQALLVAPTQVLAQQHHESIRAMLTQAGIDLPLVLLTGNMRLADRRKALAIPASGVPCIVIATHAAFSHSFQAPRLALEVIDEQHRFGVEQRETIRQAADVIPHLLVMTATPIPRSAAMTWFGNLDISWLTELPSGRKPIMSVVVREGDGGTMGQMFLHARKRIEAGERVYVICPRIDEDQADEDPQGGGDLLSRRFDPEGLPLDSAAPSQPLHSVEEMSQRLAALPQFQGIRIGTLTGRDDEESKAAAMKDFAQGQVPLLVATTVIEVGVDVPQASCIIIFDSDHFGLSQLHQLRGRVGRGGTRSWAFFVTRADLSDPDSLAARRLEVVRSTTDGAEIAKADLDLRGAGDVLGDSQSGGQSISSFKLLRVVKDADLITRARSQAESILRADPALTQANHIQLAGAVLDFSRGSEDFLVSS
ncbi:ATP-dependent DNA helicase RecG [Parascardovia denticolens]